MENRTRLRLVTRDLAVAAVVFVLATVVVTWPLAQRLSTELPRYERVADLDLLSNIWAFWWTKVALTENRGSLLFTGDLFYPGGSTLTMSAISPATTVAAMPAMLLFPGLDGIFLAWNLNVAATFVLSGLGAFLLARRVTGSASAALVAGLVFALSPYRIDHLRHVNLSCTQWLPFVFWTMLGRLEEGGVGWMVGLAASLALVVTTSTTYTAYLSLFVPFFLIAWIVARRRAGSPVGLLVRQLSSLVLPVALATLAAAPVLLPTVSDMAFVAFETPTEDDAVAFSYPIEAFATPGAPCYLSHPVALLSLYALTTAAAGPWATLALTGAALAPGPRLKTAAGATSVRLPYEPVRRLFPFLRSNRFCERFLVFWWLGAAVLVALAITRLAARIPRGRWVLTVGIATLILLDLRPTTPGTYRPPVPPIYGHLARAPSGWPVYEWPADYLTNRKFMYWQMTHGRPICQGHLSRRTLDDYRIESVDAASGLENMILLVHRDLGDAPYLEKKLEILFVRYEARVLAREGASTAWLLTLRRR